MWPFRKRKPRCKYAGPNGCQRRESPWPVEVYRAFEKPKLPVVPDLEVPVCKRPAPDEIEQWIATMPADIQADLRTILPPATYSNDLDALKVRRILAAIELKLKAERQVS